MPSSSARNGIFCARSQWTPAELILATPIAGLNGAATSAATPSETIVSSVSGTTLRPGAAMCVEIGDVRVIFSMLMSTVRSLQEIKDAGYGVPAPDPVRALYREAFGKFGAQCLWFRTPHPEPTIAMVVNVITDLRSEGDTNARKFSDKIEEACRAIV